MAVTVQLVVALTVLVSGGGSGSDSARASASGTGSCLLYTSPSPRDGLLSRMPSSA